MVFSRDNLNGIVIAMVGISIIIALGVDSVEPVVLLLRRIIFFFLLTLLPGFLILYIIGINPLSNGHYLLYSIGLSMVFLIFLAIFLNLFYPWIGISNPLNEFNILLNFTFLIFLLLLLFLIQRNKNYNNTLKFNVSRAFLFFMQFPIISAIGVYLVNFYSINTAIILLLFAISVIPLIGCIKSIPPHFYPISTLAVSLSLQFHKNLITNYVIGSDIQTTFYFANLINSFQIWTPHLEGDSVLILLSVIPTFYSSLLNISLDWAFKILNSFLYALTPVCIYYLFKDFFGKKAGFYASLFFAFQHGFIVYGTPCKQPIAEFFMGLLLLVTFDKTIQRNKKILFILFFSFAIINSHYGTSLIFLISTLIAYIIFKFLIMFLKRDNQTETFLPFYISFFSALMFLWYVSTAEGEIFNRFIKVYEIILREVWTVIFAQKVIHRTGADLLSQQYYTILYQINMIIYIGLTICMMFGVIYTFLLILKKRRPISELDLLAISLLLFLLISFFISGHFGIDRMYVLSSVVLSGYIFPGYKALTEFLKRTPLAKIFSEKRLDIILALLLGLFLLFNSGVIYQLADAPIESAISLNPKTNTLAFSDAEMIGAKWLVKNRINPSKIFHDPYSGNIFKRFYEPSFYDSPTKSMFSLKVSITIPQFHKMVEESDLTFIRVRAIVNESSNKNYYLSIHELLQIEFLMNKVYDNRDCRIYAK